MPHQESLYSTPRPNRSKGGYAADSSCRAQSNCIAMAPLLRFAHLAEGEVYEDDEALTTLVTQLATISISHAAVDNLPLFNTS